MDSGNVETRQKKNWIADQTAGQNMESINVLIVETQTLNITSKRLVENSKNINV